MKITLRRKTTQVTNIALAFALALGLIAPLAYVHNASAADEGFSEVADKTLNYAREISITDLQVLSDGAGSAWRATTGRA